MSCFHLRRWIVNKLEQTGTSRAPAAAACKRRSLDARIRAVFFFLCLPGGMLSRRADFLVRNEVDLDLLEEFFDALTAIDANVSEYRALCPS